jgi:hypothetical protein
MKGDNMSIAKWFREDVRNNGQSFVTLTDDAPEWLLTAIREAHRGDLPNDWIYAECKAAFEAYAARDLTTTDDLAEYADSRVDIYTKDLAQWYADMCLSDTFAQAEDVANDCPPFDDMRKRIAAIQYFAIAAIAQTMLQAIGENNETL